MTSEVKFTQFLWVRKGQPATELLETGMCFVKLSACRSHRILFLPFTGCPHWAYFLNRHHTSCIYENCKAQAWLRSICLTRPCTGRSFSALVTLYFSLDFLCLPASEPSQTSLHYRGLRIGRHVSSGEQDITVQSTQITLQQGWLPPSCSPRTQALNADPRGAA